MHFLRLLLLLARHFKCPIPRSVAMKAVFFMIFLALPFSLAAADDQPRRAYFGDTHLHTSFSPDAGMAGTKVGPNDAYRFVLGETVTSSTGQEATISKPLDFVVIADHAENL
ncbi:MAG: DUF3604 domain-containing protein, partial [Halieaceae bacterium]|nr:DUF3604 domain-containing protein [Halieaceae bacterium]